MGIGTSSSRDIHAYAIGTHDGHFVPVIPEHCFHGERLSPDVLIAARKMVRIAVIKAAERVKVDGISTLHPIVEGIVMVARAIANDTHAILTVSTLDSTDPDKLFYSLPCAVGTSGVVTRHAQILDDANIADEIKAGIDAMRGVLRKAI